MPLLARRVLVRDQPPVDHPSRTDRSPAAAAADMSHVRRNWRLECLAHGATVDTVPLGQLPDRQLLSRRSRLICSNSSTLDRNLTDLPADDDRDDPNPRWGQHS